MLRLLRSSSRHVRNGSLLSAVRISVEGSASQGEIRNLAVDCNGVQLWTDRNGHAGAQNSALGPRWSSSSSQGGQGEGSISVQGLDEGQRKKILNRLMYRSKQRGYLELDLVVGQWVEANISSMDDVMLTHLTELLSEENPDLWKWITGQATPPEPITSNQVFQALRGRVAQQLEQHSDKSTRAQPGAPWVRGWDDRDKNVVPGTWFGNQ